MNIIELAPAQFALAREALAAAWFDRAQIEAALEGRQPVRVFVDGLPAPRAVLLCHPYDYYAGGEPAEDLRRFIADAPAEAGVFASVYGFCPAGKVWEQAMLADYGARLERIGRRQFHHTRTQAPSYTLPAGCSLAAMDAALAERADRELGEHIRFVWGDYATFAAAGLGCCLLAGDAIASVAYPAAVSSRWTDVSVATAAALRGRGLALSVCSAYIEQCLERGLRVAWDTDEGNVASADLAQRLGLVEQRPFSELVAPGRRPLAVSRGLWAPEDGAMVDWPGARVWRRLQA